MQDWDIPPTLLKQIPDPDAIQKYRQDVLKQTEAQLDSIAEKYFQNLNVQTKALPGTGNVAADICLFHRKQYRCNRNSWAWSGFTG